MIDRTKEGKARSFWFVFREVQTNPKIDGKAVTAGIEVWEIWDTPEGERVRLRYEGLRKQPPMVRGSAASRATVLEVFSAFQSDDDFGIIPRLRNFMRDSLTSLGWQLVGHSRRENLAAAHLQAAVRQAEESAVKQKEYEEIAAEETTDFSKKLFNQIVMAGSARDRAVEASRNAVILAVAALEAFINEAARDIPSWGKKEDNISLRSKWIVVPALLSGGNTFDRGAQPFQAFQALVTLRNRLVHPRPTEQTFEGAASVAKAYLGPPTLDVTAEEGRRACLTARNMILEFCRILNREPPTWCSFVPLTEASDLKTWSTAIVLTGVRSDPDFPKMA